MLTLNVMSDIKKFSNTHIIGRRLLMHQMNLPGLRIIIKMSSVKPFTLNAGELCVVTINEKPWTRAKEVCRALEYNKKIVDIVKAFCELRKLRS